MDFYRSCWSDWHFLWPYCRRPLMHYSPPVCQSVSLSVSVCLCMCVCLSVCLCVCLSVSVCVSVCLSVCVSVSLSVCPVPVLLTGHVDTPLGWCVCGDAGAATAGSRPTIMLTHLFDLRKMALYLHLLALNLMIDWQCMWSSTPTITLSQQ